jgi:hypothetical protein
MWVVYKGEIVYYWNLPNSQDSNEDQYVPCTIELNYLSEIRPTIGTLIRLDLEGQTQVHKIESIEYSENNWPKYLTSIYYKKNHDEIDGEAKNLNTVNSDDYVSRQKTKLNDLQVKIDLANSKTK